MSFSVPVVLLVFNRPTWTAAMFETVRKLRPAQLFIIADGPRPDHPDDFAKCEETRRIVTSVDWPCDVKMNFADGNMGLKGRVCSGLDWVFDQVERAIILEDDLVPDPTFFPFCAELLERYAEDERIMSISGDNYQFGRVPCPYSYYFSRHMHCWGWATWRRAWKLHDPNLPYWADLKADGWIESFVQDPGERRHWHTVLDAAALGQSNSWAYPWSYSVLRHNGLNIHPAVNLVTNIGFGPDATHTKGVSVFTEIPSAPIACPLQHPPHVLRNFTADDNYAHIAFGPVRRHIW
jgi:hypothetical protein